MVAPDEEALVRCETTKGPFVMKLERSWSPNGYDRAVELFERKFFDDSYFYRVVPKFLVQFGISYSKDQELQKLAKTTIPDDPPQGRKFNKGTISYAGSGDNSRTHQLFIAYGSAQSFGTEKWETPLGEVIEGMETVEALYSYGDMPPWGKGPEQHKIHGHPEYLANNFPLLDKFVHCKVERINIDEEGEVIFKADKKTDEEAFAKAIDEMPDVQDRELLQLASPYRPHTKDQPGLPSFSDPVSKYGGFVILTTMGIAMMMVNARKKVLSKSN